MKQNKYHARRTEYDGVTYASKTEAMRAGALRLLERAGKIVGLERQPRFTLGCPENVYVADFRYTDRDGKRIVEDVKGVETPKFRRDVRLWRRYGPCELHIVKLWRTRWMVTVVEGGTFAD